MQSPVDKQFMFFIGSEGANWYTDDCGASIQVVNSGRPIKEFQFHPTERQWILASAFRDCDSNTGDECYQSKELYVSKDLGKTWTFTADYVIQFSWYISSIIKE